MHLHKCDQVNFCLRGGGVVQLTAKPRYLLLLHRGKEKSNTVTALFAGFTACEEDNNTELVYNAHVWKNVLDP